MTAAAHPRAASRSRAPDPPKFSWSAVGVIAGILTQLAGAIWFASNTSSRVSALEANVPPGAIQRLDERTLQMQVTLNTLLARR